MQISSTQENHPLPFNTTVNYCKDVMFSITFKF